MPAFPNIAATTAAFKFVGGAYGMTVHAGTWGGGSVALNRQACDGATWVPIQSFTADGFASLNLPEGAYQVAVTTATGVYVDVSSIATARY